MILVLVVDGYRVTICSHHQSLNRVSGDPIIEILARLELSFVVVPCE